MPLFPTKNKQRGSGCIKKDLLAFNAFLVGVCCKRSILWQMEGLLKIAIPVPASSLNPEPQTLKAGACKGTSNARVKNCLAAFKCELVIESYRVLTMRIMLWGREC